MRAFQYALAAVVLVTTAGLVAQTPAPTPNAAEVLAAAREALGGEKKLAAVKTLVTTGRTRQVRGDNLVPIEFEIYVELPDKYVRKDEVPAQESGPTTVGFNGDNLIQLPPQAAPPAGGRPGGPPPPTPEQLDAARRARLAGVKQDFARLMLGLFAGSFDGYPLTFTYAGQAEAPQGMADVLDVKGQANLAMRLFVYRDTHLPVMVTWQGGPQPGPGRGPGQVQGGGRGGVPGPAVRARICGIRTSPGTAPAGQAAAPGPAGGAGALAKLPDQQEHRLQVRLAVDRPRHRRRKTGCISRTTGTSTVSSGRSACAAPSAPIPSKRRRSTGSAPIRRSIRRDSTFQMMPKPRHDPPPRTRGHSGRLKTVPT